MQRPQNSQASPEPDDRLYTRLTIKLLQIKRHNISTNTLMGWRNGEDPEDHRNILCAWHRLVLTA